MQTLLTFIGNELTDQYYTQLNEASQREFQIRLPAPPEMSDRRYFLLVETETEKILASGYLKPIHPVICNQKTFSFLNIGGIIANDKGRKPEWKEKPLLSLPRHLNCVHGLSRIIRRLKSYGLGFTRSVRGNRALPGQNL